jgi:hypothetical protein
MYRNGRNRPWTPLDYALAPAAFWLTQVVRPIFDTLWPEPTKYKYRVADQPNREASDAD